MFKALIFDMDGTMVDSEKLHYRAWHETLCDHGVIEFSYHQFLQYVGASNEKLAEDAFRLHSLATSPEVMVREKQQRYLKLIPRIELLPGVREVIDRFHGELLLAIGSSSDTVELHSILEIVNLSGVFTHIVGGDQVRDKKPAADIYLLAAEQLGLSPTECVALEDSEPGIIAAKRAGMTGIAIPGEMAETMDFSLADCIVESIDKIDHQLLRQLYTHNFINR